MDNDFFDDDAVSSGSDVHGKASDLGGIDVGQTSGLDTDRLMRQKKELDGRVVVASNEIDLLKRRQGELEARKTHMEEIARKQSEYEKSKRDIIVQLDKSLILLEKEELQATRLVDLLNDTRTRFKDSLNEVRSIKEESWSDTDFEEELNKAIVRIESVFMMHKKGVSKIDVLSERKKGKSIRAIDYTDTEVASSGDTCHSFGYWLKAGLAFSLPGMTMIVVLFVIYLFLNNLLMGI